MSKRNNQVPGDQILELREMLAQSVKDGTEVGEAMQRAGCLPFVLAVWALVHSCLLKGDVRDLEDQVRDLGAEVQALRNGEDNLVMPAVESNVE